MLRAREKCKDYGKLVEIICIEDSQKELTNATSSYEDLKRENSEPADTKKYTIEEVEGCFDTFSEVYRIMISQNTLGLLNDNSVGNGLALAASWGNCQEEWTRPDDNFHRPDDNFHSVPSFDIFRTPGLSEDHGPDRVRHYYTILIQG